VTDIDRVSSTETSITGTITLADGSTSEFSVNNEYGWQQWGATTERLGRTVGIVEAMAEAVFDMTEEGDVDA